MPFKRDFIEFINLCNIHEVEYLVVGGLAVAIHGYPRFTGDMVIWMNLTDDNAEKMLCVIKDFGLASLKITKKDLLQEDAVLQLGVRPVRIDIMNELAGIPFYEASAKRKVVIRENVEINFIGLNGLLQSKKAAGRAQDKADIQKLKKVNKIK